MHNRRREEAVGVSSRKIVNPQGAGSPTGDEPGKSAEASGPSGADGRLGCPASWFDGRSKSWRRRTRRESAKATVGRRLIACEGTTKKLSASFRLCQFSGFSCALTTEIGNGSVNDERLKADHH